MRLSLGIILWSFLTLYQQGRPIRDKASLIKYAEPILFKTYGKTQILGERPYIISIRDSIWIMDGTLRSKYTVGGAFHIEVRATDGKVMKMIHYK